MVIIKLVKIIEQKMDEFILTSPEEELKEISMVDSILKNACENPSSSVKKQTQKFAIQSWNISQKLKAYQTLDDHYKTTFSSYYSSSSQRSKHRAKSALLFQKTHDTNNNNFSNHKKTLIDPSASHKKTISFFDVKNNSPFLKTSQKSQVSVSAPKQVKTNKIIFLSKRKLQNCINLQKEQRTKTMQNYLSHQKQIISREKCLTHSERIEKQSVKFLVYPTQYWERNKMIHSQRKKSKNSSNNLISPQKQQKYLEAMSPYSKARSFIRSKDSSLSKRQNSRSPKKRFHQFIDNIQKGTNV